jgi:hypothetical protein
LNSYSSFLYAEPSFLDGMARLLDFAGTLNEYNSSLSGEQADRIALASDWRAIGDDLRLVIRNHGYEEPPPLATYDPQLEFGF